jgi:hypothetical protein
MIELRAAGERDTPADVSWRGRPPAIDMAQLQVNSRQPAVAVSVITTHVSCCNFVITSIIEAKKSMGASIRSIPDAIALDELVGAIQLVPTACR